LDIAVCSGPLNDVGETLDMEETVWAAKAGTQFARDQPVPLAVLDRSCWWRDLPVKSLDSVGRDYKIIFRSSSFASLLAAVRSGFAVSVLPSSSLCDGTACLRPSDGFPELPRSRRSILIALGASDSLTRAMAAAIREARV
jgi:DNA-binding transcriptional LysR family regulator